MKIFKRTILAIIIATLTYAIAMTATIVTITSVGGSVVGVTKTSYQTFFGNLIIALPETVENLKPGTQLLTAGSSTSIGTLIDTTPVNDYTLVQVQTSNSEGSISTYTVRKDAQKIVAQIPLIGVLPGLYAQNWGSTVLSTIFVFIISTIFVVKFFRKKPKPTPEKTENQIGILQEMFDAAPQYPARKTKTS